MTPSQIQTVATPASWPARARGVVQRVALEIYRRKADLSRQGARHRRAVALHGLCRGVIDLEDDRVSELVHAPGARVEARSENHQLWPDGLAAYGVIDDHGETSFRVLGLCAEG